MMAAAGGKSVQIKTCKEKLQSLGGASHHRTIIVLQFPQIEQPQHDKVYSPRPQRSQSALQTIQALANLHQSHLNAAIFIAFKAGST